MRSLDSETDQYVLSAKITPWVKPVIKDILAHVDLSEAEDLELDNEETDTE